MNQTLNTQQALTLESPDALPASEPRPVSTRARPVRVCFMIDRLAVAGTERQLTAVIRNLDRRKVQPFLCLLDGNDPVSRSLEPDGCPAIRLGISSLLRPGTLFKAARL